MLMMHLRLLTLLALLTAAATGAWADDTFSTSPYETDKTFNNKVTVAANTTLTINKGTTVTAKAGLNIKSGATLTVTGGGTLAVRNQDGDNGLLDVEGTPNQPDPGMDAIFGGGTLAIDGAIVTANGGNGGEGGDGGTGGMGGNGGYGIANATVSIINGSITAIGGSGGQGGSGSSHPGEPVVTGRSGADGKGFSLFPSISGATICWSDNGTDWTPYENNTGETKRYMKAYRYTYSVSLNDGTLNPTTWTAKADEATTFSALPLEGVAEGQSVTLKYNGRRKVKSVTATKVNPMSAATAGDIGKVIGADGYIYANAAAAAEASTTAVAMIAYVGSESNCAHGLAIALEDVSSNDMSYDDTGENNNGKTAEEWCIDWGTSKPVAGAAWRLPSAYDWQRMFIACGSTSTFVEALTGDNYGMSFNCDGFTSKLSAAGGTAMMKYGYWSSTKYNSSDAWIYDNYSSQIFIFNKGFGSKVRAVLAF